jgi:N-acetyl-anhydromuramyl-L-alanine amidase AmpD
MRIGTLLPLAMMTTVAACSGGGGDDAAGTSSDALISEGTPDTTLTSMFLAPAKTAFEHGRPGAVRYLVIHDIEGSASSAINTFRAPGAVTSAHYVIDSKGAIVQMVHEKDIANHAGHAAYNGFGIGIEHAGHAMHDEYTDAEYRSSARLAAEIVKRHGIPIDQDHIVGHLQVPRTDDVLPACATTSTRCGGKSAHDDPGPFWSWTRYMALVRAAAASIGYTGTSVPVPPLTIAKPTALAITRALQGAYWLTRCDAGDPLRQTTFRTMDNAPRIESRYVQKTVDPCGDLADGAFPLVFHGFGETAVQGLTLQTCESGIQQTYVAAGEIACEAGASCAIATRIAGATTACP